MSLDITSILNSRNKEYKQWLDQHLNTLSRTDWYKDQYCVLDYYECLKLVRVVGMGGGSKIIEAHFVPGKRCTSLFNVSARYSFAVKLCFSAVLGQLACRSIAIEIRNLLRYSKLYANKICNNFLYCLGYGVNCCLLVSDDELAVEAHEKLKNYAIIRELGYDIEEYLEVQEEEGCDTFILMNLVTGPDLEVVKSKDPHLVLSARNTFEYVYSLLCSVIFLQGIPTDVHYDNFMLDRGDSVVITIGERNLYFRTGIRLVHIDYQALSDRRDLRWGDLFLRRHIPQQYADSIQQLLSLNGDPVRKVYGLAEIFKDYHYTNMDRVKEGTVFLRFSPVLA